MPGHQRPRCTATAKTTGNQCERRAIPGGTVCVTHGAASKRVADLAAKRDALAKAQQAAARVGVIIDAESPYEGAAAAMRQARMLAQRLGEVVGDLDDSELRYEHEKAGEQARTELIAYQRSITDLGNLSSAIIRAGLDERMTQLAEMHSTLITAVILAVIDTLGLDEGTRLRALRVAEDELERQAMLSA